MVEIYLGLGTNVGDRLENLQEAINRLKNLYDLHIISSTWETEPWGYTDQGKFLNLCVKLTTDIEPLELLKAIKGIEIDMGRIVRDKWGPRIIDIDILYYSDLIFENINLLIPHPGIPKRGFVLYPLNEIGSTFLDPKSKKSVAEMKENVPADGIYKYSNHVTI